MTTRCADCARRLRVNDGYLDEVVCGACEQTVCDDCVDKHDCKPRREGDDD